MKKSSKLIIDIAKQPLVIFFLISIGILIIDSTLFYDKQHDNVLVNQENLRKFVNVQYGLDNSGMIISYINSLDSEGKDELINEFLTTEALYSFALNNGLDKNDEDLKSVIAAKSKNVLQMMANAEQEIPNVQETESFFDDNTHLYIKDESYNLTLVNKEKNDPHLLAKLNSQDHSMRTIVSFSDTMNFNKVFRSIDKNSISGLFGHHQQAQILTQDQDKWYGPYPTEGGYHWIKLNTNPAIKPQFDDVKKQVLNDLYELKVEQRYQKTVSDLINNLNIRTDV